MRTRGLVTHCDIEHAHKHHDEQLEEAIDPGTQEQPDGSIDATHELIHSLLAPGASRCIFLSVCNNSTRHNKRLSPIYLSIRPKKKEEIIESDISGK
jgi:hypothetical protein